MIEWKDFPSTETPISATNLNDNFKEIFNVMYPVNSVKIFYDNLDHSNFLGFTWERAFKGKTPIGIDTNDVDFNVIGKTGGEKTHKLAIYEMPKHTHYVYDTAGGTIQFQPYSSIDNGTTGGSDKTGYASTVTYTGGDTPHNNLQPYEVASYWRRIS